MSTSPASTAARTASEPNPLVTPMTRTEEGSPPARSIRSRTVVSRRATSSLAEEGGDVEIVVAKVELVLGPGGVGEDVDRLGRGENRRRQIIGPRRTGRLLPALEAGGDDGHPHLVAHVVVDDGAKDD